MKRIGIFIVVTALALGCLPKEDVVLKDVKNLVVEPGTDGNLVLAGDAVFFNPNHSRMRLKEIKVDVFVDGKKSATVDHKLHLLVKGNAEFTVPLKVQLQTKDLG